MAFDGAYADSCEKDPGDRENKVEADSTFGIDSAKETSSVRDAGGPGDTKRFFGQPAAAVKSYLSLENLRDLRIHAQELRNQFAHLLNRGSSLE